MGRTIFNDANRPTLDVGLTMGSLGFFPGMDVERQVLPTVLSLLKMALVNCVEFALFFVDFWFQLSRWIDSTHPRCALRRERAAQQFQSGDGVEQ